MGEAKRRRAAMLAGIEEREDTGPVTAMDLVDMAALIARVPHRPDPEDVVMPPDVRDALQKS